MRPSRASAPAALRMALLSAGVDCEEVIRSQPKDGLDPSSTFGTSCLAAALTRPRWRDPHPRDTPKCCRIRLRGRPPRWTLIAARTRRRLRPPKAPAPPVGAGGAGWTSTPGGEDI